MNISFVIPNYNGENLLRKNIPKLFDEIKNYDKGSVEVIIVDDFSQDNSLKVLEKLKSKYRNLKFFVNEKNLGFPPTVNRGVSKAKGEIVILFNTDVYPERGFLEPLIKHFKDDRLFAVGCMDKSIKGKKVVLRGRGIGKWERGFLVHKRGEVNRTDTLWVSGGSGAFRKSIWDILGGFNELYAPFYWEDIDISYRALKSGYKVRFEPKSVVVHEHEKGAIRNIYTANQIKTIAYRNQFIFVWENATDYFLQFSHIAWLPYHLLKAILFLDLNFLRGFFKALKKLPKIIQSSLNYQKLFVKKDSEVISNLSQ
jgi:GT2 family glycosyltransferase